MKRLAIICSHPIQYYAPLFQLMAEKHEIKVFYASRSKHRLHDLGFNVNVAWDIPLLEGYEYEFSHCISNIKAYNATAILIYGWAFLSHLRILSYFHKRVPLYFRGDSTLIDQASKGKAMIKSLWLKYVYRHIDFAFYVGKNNKTYFEQYGLSADQLIYVPHAVDNERFAAPRQSEAIRIRRNFGIEEDELLLLFTGKFILKKGPQLLLKAFVALNYPGVHLLFVGSGVLELSIKASAASSLNNQNIHFLPFQNQQQMPAIYQSCDVFCLPSTGPGESWGLAINEAMAAGKPILASKNAGATVDLVNDANGAVFESGSTEDLTKKLEALLQCKRSLKTKGVISYQKIQSWSFQHQLKAIYAE
jgi:glycosyltransferase involved in cell wall biosynthesis